MRVGQRLAQSVGVLSRAVARRAGLDPPALGERAALDGVVAELVEPAAHRVDRAGVVAEQRERPAARRAGGRPVGLELRRLDVVERLDDLGALGKVPLEQLD